MRVRDAVLLTAAAGAAAYWGARAFRRHRRRIELTDRVVVITGASSGHGLVIARLAAARGAHLVLAARSIDELNAAEPELVRAGARSVVSVQTDVGDEAQARALVDRAIAGYGRIDVLINNAGTILVGPVETLSLDDFEQALATNFWGAVYTTMAALPHLRARRFGRIGNVVSIGGLIAMPHLLPYTASKFALTGFTRGLRAELARDQIYVTSLYPATMRTGGHTHALFKGDRQAEYTWFALSDTLPVLSTSAESAASAFLDAICHGEAEVRAGWQTLPGVLFQSILPNETAELLALIDRVLPGSDGRPTAAVRGADLTGVVPDLLNRAVPAGTRP